MARRIYSVEAGQRFGRGVVIDPEVRITTSRPGGSRGARLGCDCGNVYTAYLYHLLNGATASCGCLNKQAASRRQPLASAARTTHGLWRHPLYQTWKAMISRCEDPKAIGYRNYGARGIRVCDRWHDVAVFIADIERWLGPRPDGCTLDRICSGHDYRLDNVRWATWPEQLLNRRPYRRAA